MKDYKQNNDTIEENCECEDPTMTGQWAVSLGRSFAECVCGGWCKTSLLPEQLPD